MIEENNFISNDIVFKGIEAGYLIEVERYFDSLKTSNKPKYAVLLTCASLGLKLSDKERRENIEIEKKYDERLNEYSKSTYNIPRTVLHQNEHNLKRLLFLIATVENKVQLDVMELQKVWNVPQLSKSEGYGYALHQCVLNGAKYLLVLLQIRKLNADQINEETFKIFSRNIGDIPLKTKGEKTREFVLNEDKLLDVELEGLSKENYEIKEK